MKKLLTLILLSVMAGCTNSKDAADTPAPYVKEAEERFGTAYECSPNATDEFILCSHRPDTTAMAPLPQVAFFVYKVADDEITYDENQFAGNVEWTGDYELEMEIVPGIVSTERPEKPKYKIDVRTGDRRRVDNTDVIPN
jgi:hypothetical protein